MEMEVDPYGMWSPTLVFAYRKAGHIAQVNATMVFKIPGVFLENKECIYVHVWSCR